MKKQRILTACIVSLNLLNLSASDNNQKLIDPEKAIKTDSKKVHLDLIQYYAKKVLESYKDEEKTLESSGRSYLVDGGWCFMGLNTLALVTSRIFVSCYERRTPEMFDIYSIGVLAASLAAFNKLSQYYGSDALKCKIDKIHIDRKDEQELLDNATAIYKNRFINDFDNAILTINEIRSNCLDLNSKRNVKSCDNYFSNLMQTFAEAKGTSLITKAQA